MSRPLSIVIPDGESHFALPVVTCLGALPGVRVHVLASDSASRVRHSRYVASFTVVDGASRDDGRNDDARFAALLGLLRSRAVDVVVPVCEAGVRTIARRLAGLRGLAAVPPLPDPDTLARASDKWHLARFLAARGLPHPPTLRCGRGPDFHAALAVLPFPALLKPRLGSGGKGIRSFADRRGLLDHLERHPGIADHHIVQSQVPGVDLDCSMLCRGGAVLAHTTQRTLVADSNGYAPATGVEMIELPEAVALAARVFAALGYDGVANMDLRQHPDGSVTVIEINARYWSSLLASHAAGLNFPLLACRAALGERFAPPRFRSQRFLQARCALVTAARCVAGRGTGAFPAPHETIWPYLLADPLPHALGRLALGRAARGEAPRMLEMAEAV